MATGGGTTFNIGFKTAIVLALITVAVLSFLAFVNGYPALGWFCLGILGSAICVWILLAGNSSGVVIAILCICALIAVIAFFAGVRPEWYRLTNQTEPEMQQKQENPPKYFVLMNGRNQS
jgi:uncharacterized membrane protein